MMLKLLTTLLLVAAIVKESVEKDDHTTPDFVTCDLTAKNESCPDGFCCVRDSFLYTEIYCKPLGEEGGDCGSVTSEYECHCKEGLQCASNIHGTHASLFGKCAKIPGWTHEPDMGVTGSDLDVTTDSMNKHERSTQYGPPVIG